MIASNSISTSVSTVSPAALRARVLRAKRAAAREEARALTATPLPERKANDAARKRMLMEQEKFLCKKERERKKLLAKEEKERRKQAAKEDKAVAKRALGVRDNNLPPMTIGGVDIVNGGYDPRRIDTVVAAHQRSLGGHSEMDYLTGAVQSFDYTEQIGGSVGRRVVPEGASHETGEKISVTALSDENSPIPKAATTFRVRLRGKDSQRQLVAALTGDYENGVLKHSQVFEAVPDSDELRCKLCEFKSTWWSSCRSHFENRVEDEGSGPHVQFFRACKAASRRRKRRTAQTVEN